ncbi:MAG: acyltransferase family protein [Saprospiraceae bacterium]|nr:acyltransferase family protein [Saprospiraceae bacterium]
MIKSPITFAVQATSASPPTPADIPVSSAIPPQSEPAARPNTAHKRPEVSYIRVLAALAVVQLHTIGEVLYYFDPEKPYDEQWWVGNIYYSMLRWATPFFILLSGSIMLHPGRPDTTVQFLKKRARRILPPFFFWSVVYLIYLYRGNIYYEEWPKFSEVMDVILFKDIYYHLWFLPMIMGMYLLTPTFRIFIRHAHRRDIEYFLVFSFIVTALQHFIPNLFLVKYIGWLGYISFYVLGYYLSQYTLPWKKIFYAIALAMPPLTAFLTWWLSCSDAAYSNKVFVYSSPNVVIMTTALFLFLRERDWRAFAERFPRVSALVHRMAPYSFGVYFVHVLLLDVLKNGYIGGIHCSYKFFFNLPVHPIYGALVQACFVAALSFSLIALLSKIPGMKKWLM